MFPSGLDFPRLQLWSLSLQWEGNPFEKGEFWADLQQLKWSNTVLKDRAKGEELWGGAGACLPVNLVTVTGK